MHICFQKLNWSIYLWTGSAIWFCSEEKSEKRDIKHTVAFEWSHVNIDYDHIMAQHKSHVSEEILPEALCVCRHNKEKN